MTVTFFKLMCILYEIEAPAVRDMPFVVNSEVEFAGIGIDGQPKYWSSRLYLVIFPSYI